MDYELHHHGILGMHWGIRRYQNKDGSLTAAGKKRYGSKEAAQLDIAVEKLSKANTDRTSHIYRDSDKRRQERNMTDLKTREEITEILSNNSVELKNKIDDYAKVCSKMQHLSDELFEDNYVKKGININRYGQEYYDFKSADKQYSKLEKRAGELYSQIEKLSRESCNALLGKIGSEKVKDIGYISRTKEELIVRQVQAIANKRSAEQYFWDLVNQIPGARNRR